MGASAGGESSSDGRTFTRRPRLPPYSQPSVTYHDEVAAEERGDDRDATVSVILPSRDRPRRLDRCLRALARQRHLPTEVIVMDDASGHETAQILHSYADRLPLQVVRHQRHTDPGLGRNSGWQRATSAYVAMTDDDCRPDPEWLAELMAIAEPERIVVGPTLPDPEDGPIRSILDRSMFITEEDGRFSTCNVLYPRALLERLGGFDPAFRRAYAADTDLGQRALAAGAISIFAPQAHVYHAVHRTGILLNVRERWRTGEAVLLAKRYPHLRYSLWHSAQWQRHHPTAIRAILGLLLLPLTPATLVAAQAWLDEAPRRLEWATRNYLASSRVERLRETAGLALLETVEIASRGWSSLRYRTPLL